MYRQMLEVMRSVSEHVAERDELIELIAIALLTKKNVFLLGDTGQAKSYVINLFRNRIEGAKQFERLLSKQTDEEALFGRIDLQSLIARKPQMITTGKIPDSDIVFLDEIFKSNEAVLNSLLTALNERRYTNESETVDIPTISFFSASNEIPNFSDPAEKILLPLYDRFEIKVLTQYIQNRDNRLKVMRSKQQGYNAHSGFRITMEQLDLMQWGVTQVTVPEPINELMDDILCELRVAGIHVSDRKYFGYYPIAQAKAYLSGRDTVIPEDLLVLKNYLWTKPEQITPIETTLWKHCVNPMASKLVEIIAMADESLAEWRDNGQDRMALRMVRDEFVRLYENATALDDSNLTSSDQRQLADCIASLNDRLKSAFDICGMTFTPLEEVKILA